MSFEMDVPMALPSPPFRRFEEEEEEEAARIATVLTSESARKVIQEQRTTLKNLVITQKDTLTIHSSHSHHSSLRSVISDSVSQKLDISLIGKHVERSVTDPMESVTELSFHDLSSSARFGLETWGSLVEVDGEDDVYYESDPVAVKPSQNSSEIEVSPGIFIPLRGSAETWQAIRCGCTTRTACQKCAEELHVIEDAEHVVCPDCWMVSPVDHAIGDIPFEFDGVSGNHGVGLGIKVEDVKQWLEDQENFEATCKDEE